MMRRINYSIQHIILETLMGNLINVIIKEIDYNNRVNLNENEYYEYIIISP